jgi:hypothetical protein
MVSYLGIQIILGWNMITVESMILLKHLHEKYDTGLKKMMLFSS